MKKPLLITSGWNAFKDMGIIHLMESISEYFFRVIIEKSKIQLFLEKKSINHQSFTKDVRVLIIIANKGDSMRYRAMNQSEALILNSISCNIIDMWNINLLNNVNNFDIFIFQKGFSSQIIDKFINKIHNNNKIAIFDTDDLIFDYDLANSNRSPDISRLLNNVKKHQNLLLQCNYALVSTEYIGNLITERYGIPHYVSRNCLSREQISISEKALKTKRNRKDGRIRIGYFSGTHTHDQDFLEIKDPLIQIMKKFDYVDLYLGGILEIDSEFNQFNERVKKIPRTHWKNLPFEMQKVDINLAPLEGSNVFSLGKSEIKYLEAGILEIPTIASPIGAFKFAIKNEENGYIAYSINDWNKYLTILITNETERKKIGVNAKNHVLRYYTSDYRGKEISQWIKQIISKCTL